MKFKGNDKNRIIPMIVLILLIMGISFAFRFVVKQKVNEQLGEAYIDPETGLPYLTEMDSYYHLRMTRDIEQYGHAGDTIRDGKKWDSISYAPYGRNTEDYRPLMAYIAICFHKLLSLFYQVTLEHVVYWTGAVISTLVVIPVFILVYRLKGMVAAATASVLSAINYGYFIHTVPGFYDTDSVILWTSCGVFCFGSLFVGTLVSDYDGIQLDKRRLWRIRVIYAGLFILSLLLLLGSWYIYYLFAGILVAAGVLYVLLKYLSVRGDQRKQTIRQAVPLLIFMTVLSLFILITKPDLFRSMAGTIRSVFSGNVKGLFPNALVSVGEMRKPSLIAGGLTGLFQMRVLSETNIGIINAVGSLVPCSGAVAMCVILIIRIIRKDIRYEYVLLVLWFLITAVLAFRSWRFIMLFAVPVAVLAGMLTGTLHGLMRDNKMMDYKIFTGMIVVLMLFPAVYGVYRSVGDSLPSVNRALHESMMYIRNHTPENTVVASWWDYGYFFEEKTQRRTLFDGGTQKGKRIYWVSRALAATDEKLSGNIIRMMSGAGDNGTDRMLEVFGENRETLSLMEELLAGDRERAHALLLDKGISIETADELAGLLFPDMSYPTVFVITKDMSGIAGWFGRFGYAGDDRYAGNRYAVIADRLEYREQNNQGGWRIIRNGSVIDIFVVKENGQYRAYTALNGSWNGNQPYPVEKILVKKDGKLTEYRMKDVAAEMEIRYTLVLNMDSAVPTGSLMTSLMADSVFGRLYYIGSMGMESYLPVTDASGSADLFWIGQDGMQ